MEGVTVEELLPICPSTPTLTVPAPAIVREVGVVSSLSPLKPVISLVKLVPPPDAP